jgi:acetylornithine deacetylase/succinyl-diaminopimelate desuccinylase-like protein
MAFDDLLSEVRAICAEGSFRRLLTGFLCEICDVDTSPAQDLDRLREGEQRVFQLIRDGLAGLGLAGGSVVWKEISPAIRAHPAYSQPYYAAGAAAQVYRGRGNLLYLLDREPAASGNGLALNAHIDTVAPFFGPACAADFISGRGAADDKGNVAVILGALHVLDALEKRSLVALKNSLTAMFVIDEETGGNGSLGLAMDRGLKERYESMLVLECTGNHLHPANRGAVFVRCAARLRGQSGEEPQQLHARSGKEEISPTVLLSGSDTQPASRRLTSEASRNGPVERSVPSLPEAFAFAILELLDEGEAIRRESDHPLFPHRPVQTCTGILGPFGVHPSAICSEVGLELSGAGLPGEPTVRAWIDAAIRAYTASYGDKTRVIDPATGKRKVERHYDLDGHDGLRCRVTVYGAGGHMGSLPQNDAAITKWAFVVRELVERRRAQGIALRLELPAPAGATTSGLVFEGAQGFLPTHAMEDVEARVREAFLKGMGAYLEAEGFQRDAIACDVTFDKLHNEAYACDVNSPTMQRALNTAAELGLVRSPVPPSQDAPGQAPQAVNAGSPSRTGGMRPNKRLRPLQLRAGWSQALPDEEPPAKQALRLESPDSGSALSAPSREASAEAIDSLESGTVLRGWEVSCDARLFAREYPGLPVITYGAGSLEVAHSAMERVRISDLLDAVCFVSLFVLRETGTVP